MQLKKLYNKSGKEIGTLSGNGRLIIYEAHVKRVVDAIEGELKIPETSHEKKESAKPKKKEELPKTGIVNTENSDKS